MNEELPRQQRSTHASDRMKQRNEAADADEKVLQISMDTEATIKVGLLARGRKSRVLTKAADHDFHTQAKVTPVRIFLPAPMSSISSA